MKREEYEAFWAGQNPQKSRVKISIGLDQDPDDDDDGKITEQRGVGSGWIAVFCSLTEHQRDKMLSHLERYAELLVKECEDDIKFRDRWNLIEGAQ